MTKLSIQQKKALLTGLIFGCPMGKPLINCALANYRKLRIKEQLRSIYEMNEAQLDQIVSHHRKCLQKREN